MVTCVLEQNNKATLVSRACALFDENDGIVSREVFINDMYICLTVFGVLINP